MPDVVRLRNNHGHPVEVDAVPGPDPEHGEVVEARGRLITDVAEYRQLMHLADDAALGPDVDGYHWTFGPVPQLVGDHLRGWPKETWDLVTEATDSKTKG
jgi:hypothetical protein